MKRIIGLLFIAILFVLVLTSCWDKNELNELAIATGLSVDKAEDGYMLSVQIVNPLEISPQANASGVTPVTVRSENGETMYEAIRRLSLANSRKIYTSHLRLLVISEEVAKEGIADILDYLSRDQDFRADFTVIITKESKAKDILKIQTVTETISANALYTLLKTSGEIWGETVTVSLRELLDIIAIHGKSPVLSGMDIKGDIEEGETKRNTETTQSPAGFNYVGLGVFHKDKLIGWLNEREGKGYNYITDKIHNTVEYIHCSDKEKMSMEVMRSKTKQHVKIDKDRNPIIEVDVRTEANIGETKCSIDVENPNDLKKLEKLLAKEITKIIDETINKVQEEYKSDIFGFGEQVYRSHPKVWEDIKEDWPENFAKLDVQTNVKVKINQLGTTGKSSKQELKE